MHGPISSPLHAGRQVSDADEIYITDREGSLAKRKVIRKYRDAPVGVSGELVDSCKAATEAESHHIDARNKQRCASVQGHRPSKLPGKSGFYPVNSKFNFRSRKQTAVARDTGHTRN